MGGVVSSVIEFFFGDGRPRPRSIDYYPYDYYQRVEPIYSPRYEPIRVAPIIRPIAKVQPIVRSIIDIYPTVDELKFNSVKELKANLIDGQYENVETYLNIQLSLLREDFIRPLCDGLNQFRKDYAAGSPKSNENIYYYQKVRIITQSNINYANQLQLMIDLQPDARQKMNGTALVNSKKLMTGSLLILTKNPNMDQFILAVVSYRNDDLLKNFYIQIEIVKIHNISQVLEEDFLMLESQVFFEPYHKVYKVLSKFDEKTFPLPEYILRLDTTHHYPDYYSKSQNPIWKYKNKTLYMKYPTHWPDHNQLQLNEQQMEAIKMSLRNKFSLIHGPPGTGKTFIGLEIASILLQNTREQIIVVCQTNQALDKFLNGISKLTSNIVRMGGQSKMDVMGKYHVSNCGKNDKSIGRRMYELKTKQTELTQLLSNYQKQFDQNIISLLKIQEQLRSNLREQEELKQISDYYKIRSKRVIGMTSTWAARSNTLLNLLKPSIVFYEEAAEMLESHIIASLSSNTKHVILLGDHQQLRPNTNVYELSTKYKLDVSLFERMVRNKFSNVQLTVQHRMRPEIADLIRPHIYRQLFDHESVKNYDKIRGVSKNLFFLDHPHLENTDASTTSKSNLFEVQFLLSFCYYLLQQGYDPKDITILTTYNGQLDLFNRERKKYGKKLLSQVCIMVADGFQGEENKIILLSLVRSNKNHSIGFLSTVNRINVALSRAKQGLYIVGNMNLLAKHSKIWKTIQNRLSENSALGNQLELCCETHENKIMVSSANDFNGIEFGGCREKCNIRLGSNYRCIQTCHTKLIEHKKNE